MSGMCGISSAGLRLCRPFGTLFDRLALALALAGLKPCVRIYRPFGTLCPNSPEGTAYHRIGFQSYHYKNIKLKISN